MNYAIIRSIGVQLVSLGKEQLELSRKVLNLKCALIAELQHANPCTQAGRDLERLCIEVMNSSPCDLIAEQLAKFGEPATAAAPQPLPQTAEGHHQLATA